ncbi:MAG TPA: phosphodiesterase, partial [Roseiflexaceae bacterium]
ESLYAATQGIAPDLIAICARPGWRTTATVGRGSIWVGAGEARLDAACETPDGFLVLYDPRNLGGGRQLDEATIYDIAPTLLELLAQPIPSRLRGTVIAGL